MKGYASDPSDVAQSPLKDFHRLYCRGGKEPRLPPPRNRAPFSRSSPCRSHRGGTARKPSAQRRTRLGGGRQDHRKRRIATAFQRPRSTVECPKRTMLERPSVEPERVHSSVARAEPDRPFGAGGREAGGETVRISSGPENSKSGPTRRSCRSAEMRGRVAERSRAQQTHRDDLTRSGWPSSPPAHVSFGRDDFAFMPARSWPRVRRPCRHPSGLGPSRG